MSWIVMGVMSGASALVSNKERKRANKAESAAAEMSYKLAEFNTQMMQYESGLRISQNAVDVSRVQEQTSDNIYNMLKVDEATRSTQGATLAAQGKRGGAGTSFNAIQKNQEGLLLRDIKRKEDAAADFKDFKDLSSAVDTFTTDANKKATMTKARADLDIANSNNKARNTQFGLGLLNTGMSLFGTKGAFGGAGDVVDDYITGLFK